MTQHKIVPLEALRGMAALLVVLHHFFLAFLPRYIGILPPVDPKKNMIGTPFFLLLNGKAMVVIFFILSGYVLALKGLRPDAGRAIGEAALKRWFRFVPLITLSLLLSWGLYQLGLYHYDDAYAIGGSVWLDHYGAFPQNYRPSLGYILYEGAFGSLLFGDRSFNTALWTMHWEFYGSMIVFLLAPLLAPQRRWWLNVMLPLAAVFLFNDYIWLFPFMAGLLAASVRLEHITLGKYASGGLLMCGLYLCGYYYPQGWYGWLAAVPLEEMALRVLIFTVGGFFIVSVFATHNFISRRFQGPVSSLLGRMSFSLYLLNSIVIASLCTWAYVAVKGGDGGIGAAFLTLLLALPALAAGLMRVDEWWLKVLGRWHPLGRRPA